MVSLPTYFTLLRILLVPFLVIAVSYYDISKDYLRVLALSLFVTASFTDAIDGFIARRFNLRTNLGTFLDPLADKLLLIASFVAIYFSALPVRPPLWIVIIVVSRDIFIVSGLITIFLNAHRVIIRPNFLGKVTTVCQMCTVTLVLLQIPVVEALWYATASLTILSGFIYLRRGVKEFGHE